jgi:hypothetical protein
MQTPYFLATPRIRKNHPRINITPPSGVIGPRKLSLEKLNP